ncbi:MAG: hypothetical protein IIW48_11870, partial [Clostridia bacterium]|nr:hypothetical protein [Clostridia bacterium]
EDDEDDEDDLKGFSFAEELAEGEDFENFTIEGFDSIESGNVSKNGTVYEVVDDIDNDDDDDDDESDTESFFRGIFKKK